MPKKQARASVEATMAAILAVPKAEVDALEKERPKRPSPRTLSKQKKQKGAA